MCRLVESIKVQDGIIYNLEYHIRRMNASRKALFNAWSPIALAEVLRIPEPAQKGLFKCRVLYQDTIEKIEFVPYQPRIIQSLKRVYADAIDYSFKYENREVLNALFQQRGTCDDVLIVKNGLITDTSFANIIFSPDGRHWITPLQPLLNGTQRQYLLSNGLISEADVHEQDLSQFRYFKIINALNDLSGPANEVSHIV